MTRIFIQALSPSHPNLRNTDRLRSQRTVPDLFHLLFFLILIQIQILFAHFVIKTQNRLNLLFVSRRFSIFTIAIYFEFFQTIVFIRVIEKMARVIILMGTFFYDANVCFEILFLWKFSPADCILCENVVRNFQIIIFGLIFSYIYLLNHFTQILSNFAQSLRRKVLVLIRFHISFLIQNYCVFNFQAFASSIFKTRFCVHCIAPPHLNEPSSVVSLDFIDYFILILITAQNRRNLIFFHPVEHSRAYTPHDLVHFIIFLYPFD